MFTIILLGLLVLGALLTILSPNLLKAAIFLALVSIVLTILMFQWGASLAAVFELSICAGLIPVIFVSTISLTKPDEPHAPFMKRFWRFVWLPLLLVAVGVFVAIFAFDHTMVLPRATWDNDVRGVLWNQRQVDLWGQMMIILAGVFGVVVLFKETRKQ